MKCRRALDIRGRQPLSAWMRYSAWMGDKYNSSFCTCHSPLISPHLTISYYHMTSGATAMSCKGQLQEFGCLTTSKRGSGSADIGCVRPGSDSSARYAAFCACTCATMAPMSASRSVPGVSCKNQD